jgi:hypothetical protein
MRHNSAKTLLVGDNPFHGISHLSQERSRVRGETTAKYAAELIRTSVENGADGFMFSVSETTLSTIRILREMGEIDRIELHALVPYAYEYVRLATQLGGLSGLARKFAKEVLMSMNPGAIGMGFKGIVQMNPVELLKAYVVYEIGRLKSAAGKRAKLETVFLHEVITDMAIALDLDWIIKAYVGFLWKLHVRSGFETRNFAHLVSKFTEWRIEMNHILIATPFNKLGFQMNPSKTECDEALAGLREPNVIAMSVLAAGYLKPSEAMDYVLNLPNIKGIVVGVSKASQARETFRFLKERTLERVRQ